MVKEIRSCSMNWFFWNYLPYVILLFEYLDLLGGFREWLELQSYVLIIPKFSNVEYHTTTIIDLEEK